MVTTLVGVDRQPAAQATFSSSQDGRIVYVREGALHAVSPDGTGHEQLTFPPAGREDQHPRWSPDGTQIAFSRRVTEGTFAGVAQLLVMNVAGDRTPRFVSAALAYSAYPAWSRDGSRLVYSKGDPNGTLNLFVVDVRANREQQLTAAPGVQDIHADWSPVDDVIVFERRLPNGGSALFTVDYGSGSFIRLPSPSNIDTSTAPSWHPDGSRIAFEGRRQRRFGLGGSQLGSVSLFVMDNPLGPAPTSRAVGGLGPAGEPVWSPASGVAGAGEPESLAYVDLFGNISHAAVDGTGVAVVAGPGRSPDWQPVVAAAVLDLEELTDLIGLLPIKFRTTLRRPGLSDLVLDDRPGIFGLPAPMNVHDLLGIPEVTATLGLTFVEGRPSLQLTVTPFLPLIPTESVMVEVIFSPPGEGEQLVRFGVDGRETTMPRHFVGTLTSLPGDVYRVDAATLFAGDRALTVVGNVTSGGVETDLGGTFLPCGGDVLPAGFRAAIGVGLQQPLTIEMGLSSAGTVQADVSSGRQGAPPATHTEAGVTCLPAEVAVPGSILPATSIRASYAPLQRLARLRSAGPLQGVDLDLTSESPRGKSELGVSAQDVPPEVDIDLGPSDPGLTGVRARYRASDRMGRLTVDFGFTPANPALPDGPPHQVRGGRLVVADLPVEEGPIDLDIQMGDPAGERIDAHGKTVGLIEVSLESLPGLVDRPSLVPGAVDGVVVQHTPTRSEPGVFRLDARVHDLRHLDLVREGGTPASSCQPSTDFKLCARLTVGRPGQVDGHLFYLNFLKGSEDHPSFDETVIAQLDELTAGTTEVRLSDPGAASGPIRFFYDGPRATERFSLEKFRHPVVSQQEKLDTLAVTLTPVPQHIEGCFVSGSTVCAGRPQRYDNALASASVHASEEVVLTLHSRTDDNNFTSIDSARFKDLTFSSSGNSGDVFGTGICLGNDGEVFLDTGGEQQPIEVHGELKSYDAGCDEIRHLRLNLNQGFWADQRDVTWDHPLDFWPQTEHGDTSCLDDSDLAEIAVVGAVPVTGADLNIDTFLCGRDQGIPGLEDLGLVAVIGGFFGLF